MLITWIIAAAPLLAAQAPADLFQKAPPAIDDALRERVRQFYQYHVEGKGRLAEALVAEESKDDFYNGTKPRCLKFEIARINYSEQYTKASVTVTCTMYVNMIGFMDKPLPVPLPSLWKQTDGNWFWYAPPPSRETPFGTMRPGPSTAPSLPSRPLPEGKEMQVLMDQVKADRNAVQFPFAKGGSAQVTITNSMPGKIRLALNVPAGQGIEASLDMTEVPAGGKGVVTVKGSPAQAPRGPIVIEVSVMPTGQVIPIQVALVR